MARSISWAKRLAVWNKTNGHCGYCGTALDIEPSPKPNSFTVDHVVPVSRGGKHDIDNLIPACRTCNGSKNTKTLSEFREWKTWKDIVVENGFSISQLTWMLNSTNLREQFPRESVVFHFEKRGELK
ncbi:HNH endonuclease [Vibrio sp. HA2012]|uniref:HNH endonuclease n=1 Tax=Vibrio sp. HA2012 TaxID=1971595 RepID=UPI0012FD9B09|nr:HNH endonuclease signature motif containing protein [Vibrio sp. HA2012]